MMRIVLLTLTLSSAALSISANAADLEKIPVTIRFAAALSDRPFRCGASYDGVGSPPARVVPTDFRFYVYDVALVDRSGKATPIALDQDGVWQHRNVALLDFEDGSGPCSSGNPELNDRVRGYIPKGDYVGLRFVLGLPFDLNHGDATTAPPPLNLTALFWAWQAGYRFLKVDLTGEAGPSPDDRAVGFPVHLGDTGCAPSGAAQQPSCIHKNEVTVYFGAFDPANDVVSADLARLLAATDTTRNTPGTTPGCMSAADDPDCAGVFAALGLPFGGQAGGPQSFFRIKRQ